MAGHMRLTTALLIATLMIAATRADGPPSHPPAPPAGSVMATVNGQPLYMADLVEQLLRGPGLTYAGQLVREEIVRQEVADRKLKVTEEDIAAEAQRILSVMVPEVKTADDRRRVLNQILKDKQVTHEQWLRSIRLTARLRKLAEPKIKITDEMLRARFGRMYGEQRIARHIELRSLTEAQKVLADAKNGKDFKKMAFNLSLSQTAPEGGLLPPIGPRTRGVPPAIMQAINAMEKPGELSDPVQVGATFHVIKLDKIVPPADVKFEDVKDKVAEVVREELLRYHQRTILENLEKKAQVQYINPVLKSLTAKGKPQ